MLRADEKAADGVGYVMPTLVIWPGSTIAQDIKGEIWTLTEGWRAFGRVLLFDPTNADNAAYIPPLEVPLGEREVRDVQNINDVPVDPEGALERRNRSEKTSHSPLHLAGPRLLKRDGCDAWVAQSREMS